MYVSGYISLTLHELGHYLACRWLKVPVSEVVIGGGPAVYERTDQHGTVWCFKLFPIWGFVAHLCCQRIMPGPRPDGKIFQPLRPVVSLGITVGGPLADLLVITALFGALTLFGTAYLPARTGEILAASPAAQAGLRPDEVIVSLNGHPVNNWSEIFARINLHSGTAVTLGTNQTQYRVLLPTGRPAAAPITHLELGVFPDLTHYNLTLLGAYRGFPARAAGVVRGDQIIKINGTTVHHWSTVDRLLTQSAGTTITLAVRRAGAELTFPVTLNPGNNQFAAAGLVPQLDAAAYKAKLKTVFPTFGETAADLGTLVLRFFATGLNIGQHIFTGQTNVEHRYALGHPERLNEIFYPTNPWKLVLLFVLFLELLGILEHFAPMLRGSQSDGWRIFHEIRDIIFPPRRPDPRSH